MKIKNCITGVFFLLFSGNGITLSAQEQAITPKSRSFTISVGVGTHGWIKDQMLEKRYYTDYEIDRRWTNPVRSETTRELNYMLIARYDRNSWYYRMKLGYSPLHRKFEGDYSRPGIAGPARPPAPRTVSYSQEIWTLAPGAGYTFGLTRWLSLHTGLELPFVFLGWSKLQHGPATYTPVNRESSFVSGIAHATGLTAKLLKSGKLNAFVDVSYGVFMYAQRYSYTSPTMPATQGRHYQYWLSVPQFTAGLGFSF